MISKKYLQILEHSVIRKDLYENKVMDNQPLTFLLKFLSEYDLNIFKHSLKVLIVL